jgi:X-X-X-Leu-X-X-Gly heptad repeat protein
MFENVGLNSAKILSERGGHLTGSVEVAADKLKDGMTTAAFQFKDGMTQLKDGMTQLKDGMTNLAVFGGGSLVVSAIVLSATALTGLWWWLDYKKEDAKKDDAKKG